MFVICVIPPGWGTICDGVNCYIRKCTIYYPWLWLLINIVVISYWRWRDWFHSNLKNNYECALIIKDNRWYIYRCNNWHRHKSCPKLVEWPIYAYTCILSTDLTSSVYMQTVVAMCGSYYLNNLLPVIIQKISKNRPRKGLKSSSFNQLRAMAHQWDRVIHIKTIV